MNDDGTKKRVSALRRLLDRISGRTKRTYAEPGDYAKKTTPRGGGLPVFEIRAAPHASSCQGGKTQALREQLADLLDSGQVADWEGVFDLETGLEVPFSEEKAREWSARLRAGTFTPASRVEPAVGLPPSADDMIILDEEEPVEEPLTSEAMERLWERARNFKREANQ